MYGRINLLLPKKEIDELKKYAERDLKSLVDVFRSAIRMYLAIRRGDYLLKDPRTGETVISVDELYERVAVRGKNK